MKRYKLFGYMLLSFLLGWHGFYFIKYLELSLKMARLINGGV